MSAPGRRAAFLALVAALAALALAPARAAAEANVFVVSNGWHTEIAVPRSALPDGAIPEAADFPDAAYLVFGWGHAEYYPHPDPGFGLTLSAALVPSPAVMHMIGLGVHPRQAFGQSELAPLTLDATGLAKLVRYIDAGFERKGAPRAHAAAPGLYGFSRFYPATGTFTGLANNCNAWTAKALAAAGLPIDPTGVFRANDVIYRARALPAANRNPE